MIANKKTYHPYEPAENNYIKKLRNIWSSQRASSERREHPMPEYSRTEFVDRFVNDPKFVKLYDDYIESGKQKGLSPSFDRIDETKGYSFENIQLMTWDENRKRLRQKFNNLEYLKKRLDNVEALKTEILRRIAVLESGGQL